MNGHQADWRRINLVDLKKRGSSEEGREGRSTKEVVVGGENESQSSKKRR